MPRCWRGAASTPGWFRASSRRSMLRPLPETLQAEHAMFSHLTVGSNDIAKAKAFYDALLKPLGLVRHADYPTGIGYALAGGRPQLWIVSPLDKNAPSAGNGVTLRLQAPPPSALYAAHPPG